MANFLIYKSSAGSGKTTALVGIFVRLCLVGKSPEAFKQILAITFTNKAANEMKERVIDELARLCDIQLPLKTDDYAVNALLDELQIPAEELIDRAQRTFRMMLHDYGDLSLSTIDKFNLRLIRSFSRELGLNADFEIELEERTLFRESVDRVVSQAGIDFETTNHLVSYLNQNHEEEKKTDIVGDLNNLFNLVISDDATKAIEALGSLTENDFKTISEQIRKNTKSFEDRVKSKGEEAVELLTGNGIGQNDLKEKSNGWFSYFEKMIRFDGIKKIQLTATQSKLIAESDFAHPKAQAAIKSSIASITPQLDRIIKEAIKITEEDSKEYFLQKAISSQIHLVALIGKINASLAEISAERNILPISASNRKISATLRDEPVAFIYENIGNRYKHMLIDEFQDTSELQWLNLLPLVEDAIAQGNTALVVGDAKQSIYRWRGGKAEQFIALPQFHESAKNISAITRQRLAEAAEIKNLDTNYRSLENIIHFNNNLIKYLGEALTTEGTDYREEYTSDSATQKAPKGKSGGYIEVNFTGKMDKKDESYLTLIVTQIKDSLAAGYQFGDIAILIRSTSTKGLNIAEFLEREGIPVATNDGYSVDSNPWVMCLISMMRLMQHPEDTSAQVRVMRALSGLYQIPFEPWKYKIKNKEKKNLLDLQRFLRDNRLPTLGLKGPKPAAYTTCEQLALQYLPSKRNDLYVKTLFNIILKRGGAGLNIDDFLYWWDSLKTKPGVPTNLESNRVQLMTIHKSKGLQFKICILPIMSWKKDLGKDTRWISIADRFEGLPFAPLKLNSKLIDMGFEAIKANHDADVNFDNLNMIYVALTRAEERLYITFDTYDKTRTGAELRDASMKMAAHFEQNNAFEIQTLTDEGHEKRMPREEEPFRIKFGNLQQARIKEKEIKEELQVDPVQLPSTLWQARFDISPPDAARNDSTARRIGNILHDTISKAETIQVANWHIQNHHRSGNISAAEMEYIDALLGLVYNDETFIGLQQDAKRFSEREILSDGMLLRPDLVLEKSESIIVVDFKSGAEDLRHISQVAAYMERLSLIYNKKVSGYVLYINPLKWVQVQPGKTTLVQKTLFD